MCLLISNLQSLSQLAAILLAGLMHWTQHHTNNNNYKNPQNVKHDQYAGIVYVLGKLPIIADETDGMAVLVEDDGVVM